MWSKRAEVDYALQRRHQLRSRRRPGQLLEHGDGCDADPLLIRAARHHGEPAAGPCPVCGHHLVNLNHVFGDQLGQYSGRIRSTEELLEMQDEFGEFMVRVVEVCTDCGWNFQISTYLLGDGQPRRPPRRHHTVEDIYG